MEGNFIFNPFIASFLEMRRVYLLTKVHLSCPFGFAISLSASKKLGYKVEHSPVLKFEEFLA